MDKASALGVAICCRASSIGTFSGSRINRAGGDLETDRDGSAIQPGCPENAAFAVPSAGEALHVDLHHPIDGKHHHFPEEIGAHGKS